MQEEKEEDNSVETVASWVNNKATFANANRKQLTYD